MLQIEYHKLPKWFVLRKKGKKGLSWILSKAGVVDDVELLFYCERSVLIEKKPKLGDPIELKCAGSVLEKLLP